MVDPVEHDLELTVSALKDGPADLGITGGLVEIQRWQERIDGTDAPALEEVGAALAELRGELESDAPDDGVIGDLMRRLATWRWRRRRTSPRATCAAACRSWGTCSGPARPRSRDTRVGEVNTQRGSILAKPR